MFEGPVPTIDECDGEAEEVGKIAEYLKAAIEDGISPAEIGVFVRSNEQLPRARQAIAAGGLEAAN